MYLGSAPPHKAFQPRVELTMARSLIRLGYPPKPKGLLTLVGRVSVLDSNAKGESE